MKRIRQIRNIYKAYALMGIKRKSKVLQRRKYYVVKCLNVDEYGRGDGFYYRVEYDGYIIHVGDRSLQSCVDFLVCTLYCYLSIVKEE